MSESAPAQRPDEAADAYDWEKHGTGLAAMLDDGYGEQPAESDKE